MKRFFLLMISSVFHVISFSQVELPSYIMKDPTIYSDFKYSNEELQAIQEGNAERILWRTKEYVDNKNNNIMAKGDCALDLAYTYYSGMVIVSSRYKIPREHGLLRQTNIPHFGTGLCRYALKNLHVKNDWQLSIKYFQKVVDVMLYKDNSDARECYLRIGEIYEKGGYGVTSDISQAIKWYKKGTQSKQTDESVWLCKQALARAEQKKSILASSSTSKSKPVKEEKPVKVETPKPKQDVAVAEKPKQQVEQKVVQTPTVPKKEIYSVDVSIPSNSKKSDYTYVLIIANENYQDVENVKYALNDGRIFKEYCEKTLGIPTSNIRIKEDATLNNIISGVDWLKSICEASNGKGKCIVYYSGHGIPDESTQSSYILPVDGTGKNIRTGYSLNELYTSLGELPVESATMFIDACFSGANRGNNMLLSARGVAIKAKPEAPKGKLVVFSAAQSDETAFPYEDAKHGMFTYFLLRKLKETKGNCSLSELGDYLKENVTRTSILENDKPQTPAISVSPLMEGVWRGIMLK